MPITLFCKYVIERPNSCWQRLLFCLRQPGRTTWSSEYVKSTKQLLMMTKPNHLTCWIKNYTHSISSFRSKLSSSSYHHNCIALSPACDQSCQLPGVAESQLQQSKTVYVGSWDICHGSRELILIVDTANHLALVPTCHDNKCFSSWG